MRLLICGFGLAFSMLSAQVGIGKNSDGSVFEPQATLDVRAESHKGELQSGDGLAVPRVNAVPVDGLEQGQLIYLTEDDTTNGYSEGFLFWQNGDWQPIAASSLNSTGGDQMFAGSWYIGNPTSNNERASSIMGNISSVTHNPTLSSNQGVTYDVVMDNDYLVGDLGTDFQIISTLNTGTPGNNRFRDASTFRAVQKTSDNSFQITLWNFEDNDARRIGISVAILRNMNIPSIETTPSNLGSFRALGDLTTAFSNPLKNDVAELRLFDPSISHINGTTVPTGQASYSVYFDGTDWVYTGWRSGNSVGSSWIVDPDGFIIESTMDNPVKAAVLEFDQVRYRELPNNWVEVEMRYAADNSSGAIIGTGDYLFRLPNGFKFDLAEHPAYTGTDNIPGSITSSLSLPVDQSIVSQSGQSGSEVFLIPYSENQFRCLTFSGSGSSITNNYVGNGHFSMVFDNKVFYFRFRFKRI